MDWRVRSISEHQLESTVPTAVVVVGGISQLYCIWAISIGRLSELGHRRQAHCSHARPHDHPHTAVLLSLPRTVYGPHLRYRCRAAARRSQRDCSVWPRVPGTRPKKNKNNSSSTPTSTPPVAARRCGSHAFIRVATPLLLLLPLLLPAHSMCSVWLQSGWLDGGVSPSGLLSASSLFLLRLCHRAFKDFLDDLERRDEIRPTSLVFFFAGKDVAGYIPVQQQQARCACRTPGQVGRWQRKQQAVLCTRKARQCVSTLGTANQWAGSL